MERRAGAGAGAAAPAPTPAAAAGAGQATATTRLPDQVSDRFEQVTANQWRLIGNVELAIPAPRSSSSPTRWTIYLDTSRLVARGNVVFSDADGRIAADAVEFDIADGHRHVQQRVRHHGASASGVNPAEFAGQDPDVYFYGETIEKLGPRRTGSRTAASPPACSRRRDGR